MAITTDFPGTSLPSGWSFHSTLSIGSATVSDDHLNLTTPVGASNQDTITNSGSSNERSIGIRHALPAGDFDIAMQIGDDVGDRKSTSVNLLFYDSTDFARVRASVFKGGSTGSDLANLNGQAPNLYFASRPASGGGNGTSAFNQSVHNITPDLMTGMPAWIRVAYNNTTGVLTYYMSTDGWNWVSVNTRTQSFTPGYVKVSISAVVNAAAGTLRIRQVIDVTAYGSTDLRAAVPARTRQTVLSFTGTAGALPTGLVDDSEGATSNISWTGTALRFTDDPALDADTGGWARIRYTGTEYEECGVLLRVANTSGNAGCYGTLGLIHDNPDKSVYAVSASAASRTDSTNGQTYTVTAGHGFYIDQLLVMSGFADSTFNGKFSVVATTSTTITVVSETAGDASTGGGTITVATRSPIDQYVRGGGYALEIQSGTTRRPIRVDDPAGTNVGSRPESTNLDEMPYFWMKDYDSTQYNMRSGGTRMFRMERIGRRFRVKEWADAGSLAASLAAEPSTWDYYDGQDEVNDITLGPSFVLSHNGQKVAPDDLTLCQMDVYYMEYYQLVVSSGPTVRVKVSGSWEDSSEVRAKVSGTWEAASEVRTKSSGTWS